MVQKMILSEGFDGDRHVMSYEEAKQEIYDIASTGCGADHAPAGTAALSDGAGQHRPRRRIRIPFSLLSGTS